MDRNNLALEIGSKLRELRKSMGLTLKRLGEEAKLSAALFSRIENGRIIPSIVTLKMIADILKVDIEYFFHKEASGGYVITRLGKRRIIKVIKAKGGPFQIEPLADGAENPFMEPSRCFLPGKIRDKGIKMAVHEGQQFSYVLEGKVGLTLGRNKFILKRGDAAYWNGSIPHNTISLGKKTAITLDVHLIPGKRAPSFFSPPPKPVKSPVSQSM